MSNTFWSFVHVLLLYHCKELPLPPKTTKTHTHTHKYICIMSLHKSHDNCSNDIVEVNCFKPSMLPGSLSEIDWLTNISVYIEANVLQIPSIQKYIFIGFYKFSLRSVFTYTNLIVIFGADISSLVNKAFHYFKTSAFSSHM